MADLPLLVSTKHGHTCGASVGPTYHPKIKICDDFVSEEISISDISVYNTEYVVCVSVAKSCLTLCDAMKCSPPGYRLQAIFPRQEY